MSQPQPLVDAADPFAQWTLASPAGGAPPPRVAWFAQTPLCFVGGWEPLSFRKRAGYAWADEDAAYAQEFSDAALARYRDLGATSIVIPFAKGFGLRASAAELEQEKDIIRRAHAIGLRAATYIRVDAVVPETLRAEYPQVDVWLMRGMHGRISSYNRQQAFRRRICYSHPGAVAYLESQIRHAIQILRTDQLHLDGYAIAATPTTTCRCALCVESYRRWIIRRYPTPESRAQAFGLIDVGATVPPEFERDEHMPSVIISPDIRAWLRFQWDREAAFTRHVRRFVHQLSPDVAITINPWSLALDSGQNNPFRYFSRAFKLLPWVDGVWSEDDLHLRYEKGRVVSRTLTYKAVRETATPLCAYHWADRPEAMTASIALSLAANGGNLSCLGFTFRCLPHVELCAPVKQRMASWAKEHWSVLGHTCPCGEIGLLRHHESLAWNNRQPWEAIAGCQMLLTALGVPWRLIDGADNPAVDAVRTLIAADVECLSDAELDRLHAWVVAGGRLLVTQRTGQYDLDRRCRARHPILDWSDAWKSHALSGPEEWFCLINDDAMSPELAAKKKPGGGLNRAEIVRLGAGAVGWWPAVDSAMVMESGEFSSDAKALIEFLQRLHGPFAMRIEGPPQLITEFNLARDGRTLVHLIRTDDSSESVDATLCLQKPIQSKSVTLLSPDANPPKVIVESNTIKLAGLDRYTVLCLEKN
jgi:hypothetical protein